MADRFGPNGLTGEGIWAYTHDQVPVFDSAIRRFKPGSMATGGGGITNINISAGPTSYDLSRVTFLDGFGVSFAITDSTIVASVETNYQPPGAYLTTAMASNRGSDFVQAAAVFAGTSASGTIASNGISVSIGPYLTTAMASNRASDFVAATATIAGTSITGTVGSNGLSLSVGPYLTTAMASNRGSDFVQATAAFAGTSASGTIASNGISISVGAYLTTAALSQDSSRYAGTAGAITGGSITVNTSGISINLPAYLSTQSTQYLAMTLGGNTAGTTTFHATDNATIFLAGGNNVTLSGNGSTISINVAAPGGGATVSEFDPIGVLSAMVTNSTLGQSTLYFVPFDVQGYVFASRVNFFVSITATWSAANTRSARAALGYALYTRGTGASTDRIMRSTSYSLDYIRIAGNSSTQLTATIFNGLSNATSHSAVGTGISNATVPTFISNSLLGFRALPFPLNVTLTPGRYWMGISHQTESSNASAVVAGSVMQQTQSNFLAFRPVATSSAASNASFYNAIAGLGTYSAQSAAWPAEIPLTSDSIRALVVTMPYFNFSGIGTSSNLL